MSYLLHNFKLDVTQDNKQLPSIKWLPKLNKNLSKYRYIISTPKSYLKSLSKSKGNFKFTNSI